MRNSSRGPTKRSRYGSVDILTPAPTSRSRVATMPAAVFTMVSTILGGGVLSMPYAFGTVGVVTGVLLMIFAAAMADFSVYLLIDSSRRSGANSYEEVMFVAFGMGGQVFAMVLLVFVTFLAVVGYIVLIGNLFTPLVEYAMHWHMSKRESWFLTAIILMIMFPLCLVKSMNQLRFVSVLAVGAVTVLSAIVIYRSLQQYDGWGSPTLVSTDVWDIAYSFPIISVSYICHFNVLPLHSELIDPTRSRLQWVFHIVFAMCTVLYMAVGLTGYLEWCPTATGSRGVCPNILQNYDNSDSLITVGRVCIGATVVLSLPIIVQPLRRTITSVVKLLIQCIKSSSTETEGTDIIGSRNFWKERTTFVERARQSLLRFIRKKPSLSPPSPPSPSSQPSPPSPPSPPVRTSKRKKSLSYFIPVEYTFPIPPTTPQKEFSTSNKTINKTINNNITGVPKLQSPLKEEEEEDNKFNTTRRHLKFHNENKKFHNEERKFHNEERKFHNEERKFNRAVDRTPTKEPQEKAVKPITHAPTAVPDLSGLSSLSTRVIATHCSKDHPQGSPRFKVGARLADDVVDLDVDGDEGAVQLSAMSVVQHVVETFFLMTACFLAAILVPNVAVVWSILGSTAAVFIAYIIPAASNLKIRSYQKVSVDKVAAWCLLLFGVVCFCVCSYHSVFAALDPSILKPVPDFCVSSHGGYNYNRTGTHDHAVIGGSSSDSNISDSDGTDAVLNSF